MSVLIRPSMPTAEDQDRAVHTLVRLAILHECWDDVAQDYAQEHVGEDRLSRWGPMDTSANPLADISRQLSTPGLYGVRPEVRHVDPASGPLIDPDGMLDQAGVFTRLQHIQYLTTGAGDYYLRPTVDGDGLSIRNVSPANLYIEADANRPDRPRLLAELRLRHIPGPLPDSAGKWTYCWDVYDLRDRAAPTFRVRRAADSTHPTLGEDVTLAVGIEAQGIDPYPWVRQGVPYIPYVRYRAADSGSLWNAYLRRGTHRGTLNAAMYASFMGRSALDASGSTTILVGVEMPAGDVRNGSTPSGSNRSIPIEPGTMVFLAASPGSEAQPLVVPVGPGANLSALQSFVGEYTSRLAAQYGLTGSDLQRTSGEASSGFALFVSERGKQLVQKQVTPLYLHSDRELIGMVATMANAAGHGPYPESGYSITYHEIESSPQERAEARAQIEWETAQGYLSPVEAYQRLHPGTSREQAIASLVAVRVDQQRIDVLAKAEMPEDIEEDPEEDPEDPPSTPDPDPAE